MTLDATRSGGGETGDNFAVSQIKEKVFLSAFTASLVPERYSRSNTTQLSGSQRSPCKL
jgi:hypothetical protein